MSTIPISKTCSFEYLTLFKYPSWPELQIIIARVVITTYLNEQ